MIRSSALLHAARSSRLRFTRRIPSSCAPVVEGVGLIGEVVGVHNHDGLCKTTEMTTTTKRLLHGSEKNRKEAVPRSSSSTISVKKVWQAMDDIDIQRVTQQAMIRELTMQQTLTLEAVVPWFLENMPHSYFRQVPEELRTDHIKAISALKEANMDLYLNLQRYTPDGRHVLTFIRPGSHKGMLLKMVQELPHDLGSDDYKPLSRAQVFSSADESMSLNVFVFGDDKKCGEMTDAEIEQFGSRILTYAQSIQSIAESRSEKQEMMPGIKSLSSLRGPADFSIHQPRPSPLFDRNNLIEYFRRCSEPYIEKTVPRRFLRQRELFEMVSGSDGTAVVIEEFTPELGEQDDQHHHHLGSDVGSAGPGTSYWVNVAVANSIPQVALWNTSRLLALHNFDVMAAHLDLISDGDNGEVVMLRVHAAPVKGTAVSEETFDLLSKEIKRCKWLDPQTMDLVFDKYPWLGVSRGEIITAFCALLHPVMAKKNALVYSKANIFDTVTKERYISHAASIADLFLDVFNPSRKKCPMTKEELQDRYEQLRQTIELEVEDTTASELLLKMIDFVSNTLKTNIYMEDRYALGLRLDPKVMVAEGEQNRDLPFGVLFAHGRRFNAYHVRFRDISRGGMRLVTPRTVEQYALESAHQYDECYGLAYAQQLKNKDIPEGGSKAVNLINVNGLSESGKHFVMRKSVKAFTDTILDLIVDTDDTRENIVDYFGQKEILYLGPDEQVIPEDINWVIRRAAQRSYDIPAAFMSSKPRAGINHKEYGVTSEGVNVYLDVALRQALGIDPTKDSFTVKMTGGPDGDVAGNEIKILVREYGPNVKIVGIADHSGCAEDPDGLSHEELLRLVNKGLCISHFDPSKLGSSGVVHHVDNEDGMNKRNSMHNRLVADAFVPCGGRPNTIDITNYKQFLQPSDNDSAITPSSPLIVEGANLFVTAEARQALFEEAGVLIVKDSSANKGGVITSSYEICAAMLLSEDEFFDNKDKIVGEVLANLRNLAKMEATLLFREFEMYPGSSLPQVSQVISNAINVTTDALQESLDELSDSDREELLPLFRSHLPETMANMSFDFVSQRVPEQYIKNAIASCLASKMVYKEGTKFIEAQSKEKLAEIALKYVSKEKEIAKLNESLSKADMPEEQKKKIMQLLDAGGARTSLGVF